MQSLGYGLEDDDGEDDNGEDDNGETLLGEATTSASTAPAATNVPVLSAFGGGMLHAAAPGVSSTFAHSHGGTSAASLDSWGATGAGTDSPILSPPKKKHRSSTSIKSSDDAPASAVPVVRTPSVAAGYPRIPVPGNTQVLLGLPTTMALVAEQCRTPSKT
jgi:hypothetical protein